MRLLNSLSSNQGCSVVRPNEEISRVEGTMLRESTMNVDIIHTTISGCFEMFPKRISDERGSFVKTFHRDVFLEHHLPVQFAEEYYSVSGNGVLRGLHFQLPPHDQIKIVYCLSGEVMDVVVDLRVGSPTYGDYRIFQLSAEKANMVYIPKGLAHGFFVSKEPAIVMYKASAVYAPDSDCGIHWNSLGIPWPDKAPIISERDSQFPPLHQFVSPFTFRDD